MHRIDSVNQHIIRHLLRTKSCTRNELAEYIGIKPTTMVSYIKDLSGRELISEPERKNKRTGRKASPISINPDFGNFLGIELSTERVVVVFFDNGLNKIYEGIEEFSSLPDINKAKKVIAKLVKAISESHKEQWVKLKYIGFADPGMVDVKRGRSIKAVNIEGWQDFSVCEWLHSEFGVMARVYPSAFSRAMYEHAMMDLTERQSLVHVELGFGVGGGFVTSGEIFYGDAPCAMEIGHIVVDKEGQMCQCGNRGCLETVAGELAIRRRVENVIESNVQTKLAEADFSMEHFIDCVKNHDKAASIIAMELAEQIGFALSGVVNLLCPSYIVFSGSLSLLGDELCDNVRRVLSMSCLPLASKDINILSSRLGKDANAFGAAYVARNKYLLDISDR
jgi:predicted NBD/HSP70 family sugar kinase